MTHQITKELIRDLHQSRPQTIEDLNQLKRDLAKRYGTGIISHTTLLGTYRQFLADEKQEANEDLLGLLKRRAIRTLSGVAPITVLTKPYPCPGRCVYCPTERNMPKSYIASEPAAQRALQNKFDPYDQVRNRIDQLEMNGHVADKIELIVGYADFTTPLHDFFYGFRVDRLEVVWPILGRGKLQWH